MRLEKIGSFVSISKHSANLMVSTNSAKIVKNKNEVNWCQLFGFVIPSLSLCALQCGGFKRQRNSQASNRLES